MLHNGPEREVSDPGGRPAPRGESSFTGLAREVVLIALAILLYFGSGTSPRGTPAPRSRTPIASLRSSETSVSTGRARFQAATVSNDAIVTLANWVYIFGHWPVILGVATALYLYRRRHYYVLRNAMFTSGLIGFLLFGLFPVAPPRLLDLGLVDTVTDRSDTYRALQPPGLTNHYAAFPSLHAGWNLLVAVVVVMAVAGLALVPSRSRSRSPCASR